jgi:Sigma-70 region 2
MLRRGSPASTGCESRSPAGRACPALLRKLLRKIRATLAAMQRGTLARDWCDVRTVAMVKRDVDGGPLDFEEFYQAEFPGLVRSMFLLAPDIDEAQELAQEAMVRVYERWDRVSTMDSPGGYLYRVLARPDG